MRPPKHARAHFWKTRAETAFNKITGKGAFSKSYILKKDGHTYCGKFIPKSKHQMGKQLGLHNIQEFTILSKLQHKNIVDFVECIETSVNYCLVTEYYPHKSMFELIQRRGKLTIYEVRYFSKQLLSALKYLHTNNIVHRDIKPQNMLLDKNMNLKLSDFGMSVNCERSMSIYKRHIYGTPNYISPEMITKSVARYNYKVDIWAVGCFLFHMYTGRTPFRGKDEKMLYSNIQNCAFSLPFDMPEEMSCLVQMILQKNPETRPDARRILNDIFYKNGFTPSTLPVTALVEKPKFIVPAKPSTSIAQKVLVTTTKYCENKCFRRFLSYYKNYIAGLVSQPSTKSQETGNFHDIEYPMLAPFVWIEQVVKQNRNIGYILNDGTTGMLYDDKTVLVLLPNHRNLYYVVSDRQIKFYSVSKHSDAVKDKLALLTSLFDLQVSVSRDNSAENTDWLPVLPYLQSFYETTKYYIILLSNGLYQLISKSHDKKLLLCTKTSGFSVLNGADKLKTYDLNSLSEFQYPPGLNKNLQITCSSLHRVLKKNQCFACKKIIESHLLSAAGETCQDVM